MNESTMEETIFANELNDEQREAVQYVDGPSLVIAGAGAGKTRVLTYKIAYLLSRGMAPWNILALTFTNKAAREMQERVARKVGKDLASRLWMGTFHSVFARILRMEAGYIGFTPHYTIYDQTDARSLVKGIIKEMGLDDKQYKPATVAAQISNAKNRLVSPGQYLSNAALQRADTSARMPRLGEIYQRYTARCRNADAMDFDDLLFYTYKLFDEHDDVRRYYAERFHFVLVDEYQDTNFAQHSIVWQLTKEHQHLCVVGDDAQSIYSFRGANIDNILNFSNQYKGARIIKLERNYRSTQAIVNAANNIISHNERQIPKKVFSRNDKGEPLKVYATYSDLDEAETVTGKIVDYHLHKGVPYDGVAILYRTNAQSRAFEEALRKRGLPYRIYGGLSFYQRKEIKDVVAYCRLVVNPNDEEAFKRIINYPARGIGQTTVDKLVAKAVEDNVSLWDVVCHADTNGLQVNKGTLGKLKAFTGLISNFIENVQESDAATVAMNIVQQSGIMAEIFHDSSPESISRQENISEFLNGVKEFVDIRREEGQEDERVALSAFLQEIALLTDMDDDKGDDEHKITLMTVHAAKGLEFEMVFVVGLEEELFPSQMSAFNPREIEEERRLFYVAVTRAEKYCFLTYARSRFRYGKTEFCNPSRFLQEIKESCVQGDDDMDSFKSPFRKGILGQGGIGGGQRMEPPVRRPQDAVRISRLKPMPTGRNLLRDDKTASALPAGKTLVAEGQIIEHERFGVGTVLKVEGEGENTKATVRFQNTGTKQLLLRFARFKVIG